MDNYRLQSLGFACSFNKIYLWYWGFPDGSDGKESTCNSGDLNSIPGVGRFPGEGNGYPLQYSCLEKFMYRGAWRAYMFEKVEHDWVTNT